MKILWVKAGGLVPPDTGGKIRSYNILLQLAKHHAVTFFSFYAAHENDVHAELSQIFQRVILIPLDLPPAKSAGELLDYAVHLFSREPYNLTKYCRPVVRKKLRTLLQEETYDVILCDFLVAAGVIPWDWPCPKVLFTHNVEAVIWQRHYEVARNPLWKALSWREWKRMEAAERRYLQKADHVLAVSENDRAAFARFVDPQKITVMPTGADTEFFQPSGEKEIPNSLVFTGSMDWLPNEDGIFYFANEIFPLIRRQAPDATLCIVGRKPSRRLQDLASRVPNIQLTGWVEDVRPYLARRAVCIVPLRVGGGTRLKIFEAMSMAKAVVSTSIGAEGLPVKNGEHLLIADDPASFAENTLQLLGNSSQRAQIGHAARRLVEENYSWAMVSKGFAQVLENAVKRNAKARAGGTVDQ
jgi:sugar transferase (PEP-CTERM/EpsH1 system associated)